MNENKQKPIQTNEFDRDNISWELSQSNLAYGLHINMTDNTDFQNKIDWHQSKHQRNAFNVAEKSLFTSWNAWNSIRGRIASIHTNKTAYNSCDLDASTRYTTTNVTWMPCAV